MLPLCLSDYWAVKNGIIGTVSAFSGKSPQDKPLLTSLPGRVLGTDRILMDSGSPDYVLSEDYG